MIPLKSKKEIEIMVEGGKRLRQVLEHVLKNLKPGITTLQLDKQAEEKILAFGGKPSFKMVPGYAWATCITVNEEVVHGIPGERKIKEGDVVGVDMGMYYKGFHTDMAETIKIKNEKLKIKNEETERFLETGRKALEEAIKMAKAGNYLGQISKTIEGEIKKAGFSPVRALTGHGIGRILHEEPQIPCFLEGRVEKTPKLKKGMTLAIEVIYNLGLPEVVLTSDGWTIKTKDGKISGLFEETVAVTANDPLVLTK
ncbi:MAG: type I methionyl aminopeptidase [Patescibacteria group bacterium]